MTPCVTVTAFHSLTGNTRSRRARPARPARSQRSHRARGQGMSPSWPTAPAMCSPRLMAPTSKQGCPWGAATWQTGKNEGRRGRAVLGSCSLNTSVPTGRGPHGTGIAGSAPTTPSVPRTHCRPGRSTEPPNSPAHRPPALTPTPGSCSSRMTVVITAAQRAK